MLQDPSRHLVSATALPRDAESFFKPRVAEFAGGPRNLDQVLEGIDLCIAFKDAQQASVLSFLEKY